MKRIAYILGGILFGWVFLWAFSAWYVGQRIESVDFDTSMQRAEYEHVIQSGWGKQVYDILKTLYLKNNPQHVPFHEQPLIPKKLHQIWLGSPLPKEYKEYTESWQRLHPDWEYKLWTDADLQHYSMINRDLYDKARNYGERADIARYEILYKEGGVYADTDYECLKSLDQFNHYYDFYIGIQPLDTNIVQLGIGLIGAAPKHKILEIVIKELQANSMRTQQIIAKTGPVFFTQIFCMIVPQWYSPVIALPPTYFYPRGYNQPEFPHSVWQKPESYAVHHWAGSWRKPEGFVR